MTTSRDEPLYVISVVARMVGLHAQTLRYYERAGLIAPSRSVGNRRYYSERDLERLRRIKTLMDDMGMNLAGAEVVLRLTERIGELEQQVYLLTDEIHRLHAEGEPRALQEGRQP
ncbi:MAG: MerR family transcriptional regulator [Dehalococcoidia bacterium]|nr:MerR family transcriptional regulator [Dehalococcoidia bacterium]